MLLLELEAPPVEPPVDCELDCELGGEVVPLEELPPGWEVVPLEELLLCDAVPLDELPPWDADAEPDCEPDFELLVAPLLLPPLLPEDAPPELLLEPAAVDVVVPPSPGLLFVELQADSMAATSAAGKCLVM